MVPEETIIAAGPVIIEDGKVLLNREIKMNDIESPFFMFPGGKLETIQENPEDACHREVREELGLDIDILRPLKTLIVERPDAPDRYAILVHYLAKRKHPEKDITPRADRTVEWGWFDIHDLPKNCTDNVQEVIAAYLQEPIYEERYK